MLYALYDIALILLTPLIIPYHLYRSLKRGRSLAGFPERFGFISAAKRTRVAGTRAIWVHAVSVGETMAVRPLLKELKRRHPEWRIVLSNGTETGQQIARGIAEVDLCLYFPFDYRFAANRALHAVDPALVIIVETELWPNFLLAARRRGIPTVLVNGRISDRSFPRYCRFSRFFAPILAQVSAFCMQTDEDARRIVAIGAPAETVHVSRNLKYDLPVAAADPARRRQLRRDYRIPEDGAVLTAGSTHPGEEEAVVVAFEQLRQEGAPFLVLVPRHPERAAEVGELLRQRGIPYRRRSQLDAAAAPAAPGTVLLVDTIGELMQFYALADVVFVGGSLVDTGGHNLLEPASVGAPVLFGPHMHNFREITALVLETGAGSQVADGAALAAELGRLLADPARRERMGAAGLQLLARCGGAAVRHLEIIDRLVPGGERP